MSGPAAAARAADWRLGAFFAAYFATAGIFVPYFPLYLQDRGLTAAQIGIVLAMMQGMRVVGPNLWGYLADRTSHRIAILRGTALATAVCFAAILLAGGFGWVFAVMLAVSLFITAQIPVGEAITAARLRIDGSGAARYGRLRAWGSIGFITLVLAAGPLFDRIGIGWQAHVALALLALSAVTTFLIEEPPGRASQHPGVSVRERLAEPRVRWFLASAALMVFAHGAYYTYFSLHLAQLGYSKTQIGLFWVAGVVAEIAVFYTQGRFFECFGAFRLLAASFLLAALRFFLVAEFAHLWLLLFVAQVLHAATFAVHHSASIMTIQQWFPGRAGARGQAIYISIGYGVGGTAGSLVAAWLWSAFGPAIAFLSSSAAALAGWWAVHRTRAHDRTMHARAATSAG
ncbi:MAG: MFS transporter [Burkholderiaceae bacterium]